MAGPYDLDPGARSSHDAAVPTTRVTVGEAARRAQLTPKAVRLYEARGLLPEVARSPAGYRLYSDDDVRLLRFIGQARAVGLGLDAIRTLVDLRRDGTPPSREVLIVLDDRLRAADRTLAELAEARGALAAVVEQAREAAHRDGGLRLCRVLDRPPG
jgi:DNA-binding transcriptional MerR regulator